MELQYFPSGERGSANHGWLIANFSFSFANYYDPKKMGFETLRVLNDDWIAPGGGFGAHPHRDMEIISIPLEGAIEHKDSMGNVGVISKGEVQVMSAGTGVVHSEYNHSQVEHVVSLQIWVETKSNGIKPHYGQRKFNFQNKGWTLLVSPDERDGSLKIHQDAFFSYGKLNEGEELIYKKFLGSNEVFIFLIEGNIRVFNRELSQRDALGIKGVSEIKGNTLEDSEVLILEVPRKG